MTTSATYMARVDRLAGAALRALARGGMVGGYGAWAAVRAGLNSNRLAPVAGRVNRFALTEFAPSLGAAATGRPMPHETGI